MRTVAGISLLPLALAAPQWPGWSQGPPSQGPPSWSGPPGFGGFPGAPSGQPSGPPSGPPSFPFPGFPFPGFGGQSETLYFSNNDPSGSSIVALSIDESGMITGNPVKTSSGGIGSFSVNGSDVAFPTSTLQSQGSVIVKGNYLFTVNAGSNTIAFFTINPFDPLNPTLVDTASTLGDFPVSVDYSPELETACVLNGGATAGVACFKVDPWQGLTPSGGLRTIASSIIDETTPPSGPPGSASELAFNPAGTALFATIKGSPKPEKLASLLAWPVTDGVVGDSYVNTQISPLLLSFGFQFLSDNEIFLANPAFGVSFLTVQSDFTATIEYRTAVTGQGAICWTAVDKDLDSVYGIDAAKDIVHVLNATTGASTGSIPLTLPSSTLVGMFDSIAKKNKLYGLPTTNGIIVLDLVKQEQIQYYDLTSFGDRQGYTGLATWP